MTRFKITPLNRPVESHAWMSEPISPERRTASEAYQKQYDALRQQFKCEWVPPPGYSAERDDEEMENIECAAFSVWEERREGRTAAASTPVWMDSLEYWLIDGTSVEGNDGLLARLPTAASLKLPFILKGGGDMQIAFETKKIVDRNAEAYTWFERRLWLRVRTEHGVCTGHLERECSERNWRIVSLPSHVPQAVANRVAATLDAINELRLPDDYPVVMPVSDHCSICHRPLTDIVSKTLGIGPDCAAKIGVQHSAAIADAIIVKRHAFASIDGAPTAQLQCAG